MGRKIARKKKQICVTNDFSKFFRIEQFNCGLWVHLRFSISTFFCVVIRTACFMQIQNYSFMLVCAHIALMHNIFHVHIREMATAFHAFSKPALRSICIEPHKNFRKIQPYRATI